MKGPTIAGNVVSFDLEGLTDAVADLNAQRHRHGCRCSARASFQLLGGNWFSCKTTHDVGCPAVSGGAR